ncbi:MAG: NADH-quinone oxidoreductase subunit N [Opitutaceae bacterium]|jgi:NADH-quinone oxidoreductase subunit N
MTIEFLQQAAATNDWAAIMPEIMLAVTALILLVLELVLDKKYHDAIPGVSIAAQLGIAAALFVHFRSGVDFETFSGLIRHTTVGQFMRLFFVLTSIFVSYLGIIALRRQQLPRIEFFTIVLLVSAAMMLLAQANHFVMYFVTVEAVAIGFFILASYFRTSSPSLEAGLKYLIMSGLSSAILLFGITLLYGVAGNRSLPGGSADSMNFEVMRIFLHANPGNMLASVGIVLVLTGSAFKIGAFPFQMWVPDVYQGAPTPVTAFLAIGSKAAGFAVLLTLSQVVFAPYQGLVVAVLGIIAIGTILFGNLAALTQSNVKRLMGLSGVSHAGYLLIGVIALYEVPMALSAILFYLFAYLLAAMAVFGVMMHVSNEKDHDQELDHYIDLAKQQPFLGAVLAIGLGSLAGIPPLAGFVGKLLIFISAFKAGLYPLLAVAVVGVVLSIYYYFGWIKAAFFTTWQVPVPEGEEPRKLSRTPVTFVGMVMLGTLAAASVVLGFYQGAFGHWLLGQ